MARKHSSSPDDRLQRRSVIDFPCPRCGEAAGLNCIGAKGNRRYASHKERWDAYYDCRREARQTVVELVQPLRMGTIRKLGTAVETQQPQAAVQRAERLHEVPQDSARLQDPFSERQLQWLRENLSINVKRGDWTDPNNRTVVLKLADEEISTAYFDVTQKPEYEG